MPTGLLTRSQYTTNPPIQVSVDSALEVRGWYSRNFIAGDGVTPVQGNTTNGEEGPYYSIGASLNGDGDLVVAAQEIQVTTLSNPTANYFEGLWVDGAFVCLLLPNTRGVTGWQIPSVYGDPIAYDEIATYNRARRLVYAPDTYFTADQVIQEIERLAGNFDYMAVGVNGIGRASFPPVVASEPIVLMENDPRVGSYFNILSYSAATTNTAAQNTTAIGNAVTAAAALGAGIYIPVGTFPANSVTISVPIQFAPGASILRPATGQTVTITKAITADTSQHFDNALSGQGTISFSGNSYLDRVYASWWGTAGTAIQAAIVACGGKAPIQLFSAACTTLTVTQDGTILEGNGTHTATGAKGTLLTFNGDVNGAHGILVNGAAGVVFKNFHIESTNLAITGGNAIQVQSASALDTTPGVIIEHVQGTWVRGATGVGIQCGVVGDGTKSVYNSKITNCSFGTGGGVGYRTATACTSINFDNCYSIGNTKGFHFYQSTYCSATNNCAADTGDWGYYIESSVATQIIGCGAENNTKGRLHIGGASDGWVDIGGRGVGNNTSADVGIGSYWNLDASANQGGILLGGFDSAPNAATTANFRAGAGNGLVDIIGYYGSAFSIGIGGDATWKAMFLQQIGGAVGSISARFTDLAIGSNGTDLTKVLKGSVTIDPANINANSVSSQIFALTGAVVGDTVILNPPAAGLTAGLTVLQAFINTADQVTILLWNSTGAPIDQASASWNYLLIRG